MCKKSCQRFGGMAQILDLGRFCYKDFFQTEQGLGEIFCRLDEKALIPIKLIGIQDFQGITRASRPAAISSSAGLPTSIHTLLWSTHPITLPVGARSR